MRIPTEKELAAIEKLLVQSGLPTDDLHYQDLTLFRIEGTKEDLIAVGGLEKFGDVALIRSIATAASMQGKGIAGVIINELEDLSSQEGVKELYLLTESAEGYFESRGYSSIARSEVPHPIRNSRQFSSICPDSAAVMCKRVGA